MANNVFGWELLYKSVEAEIKSNQDVLLCFVHLVLVSSDFRCVGLGESKTLDGTETKSETLPAGWSQNYALRYVHKGRLYNLKATALDDAVMINLVRVDERTVSFVQLNTRVVVARSGTLEEMIPDHANIVDVVRKQLIEKVTASQKTKETSSQTEAAAANRMNQMRPEMPGQFQGLLDDNSYGYGMGGGMGGAGMGVGIRDLDPFAGMNPLRLPGRGGMGGMPPLGGGGGMLFQPPTGPAYPGGGGLQGLPPGAAPPGARFDPFRPPDVDRFPRRRNNPDNDDFPPPGYDDMFM